VARVVGASHYRLQNSPDWRGYAIFAGALKRWQNSI